MSSLTRSNGGWLRKITAPRMIPCLLAQVLIVSFCIPQTLEAGKQIRRQLAWDALPRVLNGAKKVTIILSEGGAVRSDAVSVLDNSIQLHRITLATDPKRFPGGSETSIARGSVKELRVERIEGKSRGLGLLLGAGAGLAFPIAVGFRGWGELSRSAAVGRMVGMVAAPVGGGVLGYFLGKQLDRQTTIVTVVD